MIMKKSNLKAEFYKLNELPPAWTKNSDEEELKHAAQELGKSDEEILTRYTPREMADKIRKKSETKGKDEDKVIFSRTLAARILIPAAAGLLLAALFLPMTGIGRPESNLEMTRVKGSENPKLKIYRKSGQNAERLEAHSKAEASDLLQLSYQVNSPSFGLILSIDGNGMVTKHLPEEGDLSPRLSSGGEQNLPFAYELDDAPEFETFYFITSDRAFSTEMIMDITASAASEGNYLLNIPSLLDSETRKEIGKIKQDAVPIRKED